MIKDHWRNQFLERVSDTREFVKTARHIENHYYNNINSERSGVAIDDMNYTHGAKNIMYSSKEDFLISQNPN